MLTDNELDVVMCTELAAIQELLQTDATTASIRDSLRLIARTVEREAYRRAAAECEARNATVVPFIDGHGRGYSEACLELAAVFEALGSER